MTPGSPMARMSAGVPRPLRQTMNASRKRLAVAERQNTVVQVSVVSSDRTMRPPVLHSSAAPQTSMMPSVLRSPREASVEGSDMRHSI